MSSESPHIGLFIDGDLIAAATYIPKKNENQTLNSASQASPELPAPHNLIRVIEAHFFDGKCVTRVKTCFFTAASDTTDPEKKAHKMRVITAMKAAGFHCKTQSVDTASSVDAVMTSKAMKALYKHHTVNTFVFLSHSPHLEAILEEVADEGKDSFLVVLGAPDAAHIAPEVKACLASATRTGRSNILGLSAADLFNIPFVEGTLDAAAASLAAAKKITPSAAPVMAVTSQPALADLPNPLTPPAPSTVSVPSTAESNVTQQPQAPAPEPPKDAMPKSDGPKPPSEAASAAQPPPPPPPPQPSIADFRLPANAKAYWDKGYSRFYYVVSGPNGNATTWNHPGGPSEDARIDALVKQWAAATAASQTAAVTATKKDATPPPAAVVVAPANPAPVAQQSTPVAIVNPPPPQQQAPSAVALPKGWEQHIDKASGRTYYYDTINKRTTWQLPPQ